MLSSGSRVAGDLSAAVLMPSGWPAPRRAVVVSHPPRRQVGHPQVVGRWRSTRCAGRVAVGSLIMVRRVFSARRRPGPAGASAARRRTHSTRATTHQHSMPELVIRQRNQIPPPFPRVGISGLARVHLAKFTRSVLGMTYLPGVARALSCDCWLGSADGERRGLGRKHPLGSRLASPATAAGPQHLQPRRYPTHITDETIRRKPHEKAPGVRPNQ